MARAGGSETQERRDSRIAGVVRSETVSQMPNRDDLVYVHETAVVSGETWRRDPYLRRTGDPEHVDGSSVEGQA